MAIASAVATARDLVNTLPSHLHPDEFAKRAKLLGTLAGLTVEVLDEKALAKAGYGGIIGVGKGSVNPPRLVRLTYKGGRGASRRRSPWSARASPSTPAASRSSRPPRCTT